MKNINKTFNFLKENLNDNTNNNNNNSNENDSYTYILVYFLLIYFSYQGFLQLFSNKEKDNNLDNRSSDINLLNFISSVVLLLLLILIRQDIEVIKIDKTNMFGIFFSVILITIYCFQKTHIKYETLKEKENNINKGKKTGINFIIFFYILISFVIIIYGFIFNDNKYRLKQLISIIIVISLYLLIVTTRNKINFDAIFNLGLFIYPVLFISINKPSSIFSIAYNTIFFSTFALFSYFGVQYFYEDKHSKTINRKQCQINNLNQNDLVENSDEQAITNKKIKNNIKYLYLFLIASICMFITIIVFLYYFLIKKNSNM